MPVVPPKWEPFGPGRHYKHMARHDVRIWERFLERYAGFFTEAAYDVAFGGSVPTDPNATEDEIRMWRFNTAKRVDAIARNADVMWLCEVRPGSGLSALGAVLGYGLLADLEQFPDRPMLLTVVTDHTDADTRLVLEHFEVQLIELPEPEPGEPIERGA